MQAGDTCTAARCSIRRTDDKIPPPVFFVECRGTSPSQLSTPLSCAVVPGTGACVGRLSDRLTPILQLRVQPFVGRGRQRKERSINSEVDKHVQAALSPEPTNGTRPLWCYSLLSPERTIQQKQCYKSAKSADL